MSVSLTKGQNVNLSKDAATGAPTNLDKLIIGLGWDPAAEGQETADLDVMAFLLKADGKVRSDKDFVYYNNKEGAAPAVVGAEDDLTGGSSETGDDEQINVTLSAIPADVEAVRFLVAIYEAKQKNQNFGQVKNAYVRVVNAVTNEEVVRYDLTEDYSACTDVMVAELYRHNGEWKFKAIGEGSTKGSKQIADELGVNA
jgi:tellurium resistance protein TerD